MAKKYEKFAEFWNNSCLKVIGTIDPDSTYNFFRPTLPTFWVVYYLLAGLSGFVSYTEFVKDTPLGYVRFGFIILLGLFLLYYPIQVSLGWLHLSMHHMSYGALFCCLPFGGFVRIGGLLVFDEIFANDEIHFSKDKTIFSFKERIFSLEFDNEFVAGVKTLTLRNLGVNIWVALFTTILELFVFPNFSAFLYIDIVLAIPSLVLFFLSKKPSEEINRLTP